MMPTAVVRRPDDQRMVGDFLEAVQTQASALLIGGEAGIGKTTLWLDSLERAHESGFRVLTARAGQLETALAYTTVGDLLSEVATPHMASIPDMQLQALNRVLMREDDDGPETNQRMIATAFKSVVEALAVDTPTATALIEALRTFEQLESPVWAARVRAELTRTNVSHAGKVDLTPTEQRVAELAADGLSNRDIAAAANVAIKTVEANLSRVYRKLGVRSRVELGRRMDQLAPRTDAPER